MSALDLTRLNTTIRRCAATLLDASYTDGIPTETTDVWRTIAADAARDLTALITRLRAAEARTAWQPIETAPRDCCVIAWADEWARPDVAWYCAGAWWSGCGSPCPEITHWQPLPAAPEAP